MNSVIVIKLGGSSLQNSETLLQLAKLVRGFQKRCYHVVVVHGGGPAINAELTRRNIKWQFINGQRQTTPEMMTVIDEVLARSVNGTLVEELRLARVSAIGLSGADDEILFCTQANEELICVGKVEAVRAAGLKEVLTQFGDKVPVIAPIGYGSKGEKYNINADWAACQIAIALSAKKLIFLTDQNGILDHNKQLIPRANSLLINQMIASGAINGGMLTKVKAMMAALNAGVKYVNVLHASLASQALRAEPVGTMLKNICVNKKMNKEVVYERAH